MPTNQQDLTPQNDMPPSSVLEPEYAVGVGLITQDQFDAMKNEFFAQSELSAGLILPVILLAFAVSYWLSPIWRLVLAIGVGAAAAFLYFVAVERRFQYRFELKMLILGYWDKAQQAKKKSDTSNGAPTKQSIEEKLTIAVDLKPLTVDFRQGATTLTPAPPAAPLPDPSSKKSKT